MRRREFLLHAAAAWPALGLAARASAEPVKRPPNILLIVVDDLGWRDLACYGGGDVFETPNIDRLASEGVKFTRAFVTAPVCSPCRSALITGMYQTSICAHHHRSSHTEAPIYLPAHVRLIPE